MNSEIDSTIQENTLALNLKNEFCDKEGINALHVYIDGKKKKKYKTTKDKKYSNFIHGVEKGWMNWDKKKIDKYNNKNKKAVGFMRNAHNVKLKETKYMVLDIDYDQNLTPDENDTRRDNYLEEYGNFNITYSVGSKYPHLYRIAHPDDVHTDWTNFKPGLDLRYTNVFEHDDAIMHNVNLDLVFDSGRRGQETNNKKQKKIKLKTKKIIKSSNNKIDELVSNEEKEILDNIDVKYIDNYGDWLKLIWGLYNHFENIEVCDYLSRRGSNYDGENVVKKYISDDKRSNISWGTVCWYSRQSNEQNFMEIKRKYRPDFIDGTDNGLAIFFLELEGDNIINDKGSIYICESPFWKLLNTNKGTLINYISKTLQHAIKLLRKTAYKISEQSSTEEEHNKYGELIEAYNKLKTTIGSYNKLKNISTMVMSMVEEKEYPMNKLKPNYFCFKNCSFDLETRQIVEVQKYDFITTNTGYDYIEPKQEQIDFMNNLIKQIMPNEELRKCVLSVLKCGLIGKLIEKFILFNGSGRNGKGLILSFFKSLAGKYCTDADKTLITQKARGGANPALANLEFRRCAIISEPEDDEKIQSGIMKELTGNPTFSTRQLYQEEREFINMLMLIMECNSRPDITGRKDNAILSRLVDVPFTQEFGTDEDRIANDENYHRVDPSLKDDTLAKTHRSALFKILMDLEYMEVYEPNIVKDRTKHFLMSSDNLMEWFFENYEQTDNKKETIKIKDIYDNFKMSEFYRNFDHREKRKWNKMTFVENIKNNIHLRNFFTSDRKKVQILINHKTK